MPHEFSGNFEQKKQKEELPSWAYNIKIRYSKHKDILERARIELGDTIDREGKIRRETTRKTREALYAFLREMGETLPNIIPAGKQTNPVKTMNISTGRGIMDITSERQYTKYFLPTTNEIYEIDGNYVAGTSGEELFPESPNFLGIEEIRNKKYVPGEPQYRKYEFRKLGKPVTHGELNAWEIENIINHLDATIKNPRSVFDKFKNDFEKIKEEGEKEYTIRQHEYAKQLKETIFDLIDSIGKNSDKKIPDKIMGGFTTIGGSKQAFLLTHEKKIVVVPTITRKNWLRQEVEEWDFNLAKEADDKTYTTGLFASELLKIFPRKIRDLIEDPD